jgi:hypothetical protein
MGRRNGVRKTRVWLRLLGLQRAVIQDVQIGDRVNSSSRPGHPSASVIAAGLAPALPGL